MKKTIVFNFVYLILTGYFIFLALYPNVKDNIHSLTGDGEEYLLMSEAFIRSGMPSLLEIDRMNLLEYGNNDDTNIQGLMVEAENFPEPPYFTTNNGQIYSWHFWLYSLYVAPFLFIIKLLGLKLLYAFYLANLALALLSSMMIFTVKKLNSLQKLLLLTLYWVSGTIAYITWSHPEVFCASLMLIAFLLIYEKQKLIPAAFLTALASTQNPPVAIFTGFVLLYDYLLNTDKLLPSIKKSIVYFFILAIVALPAILTYLNFGVTNLIAANGYSVLSLISVSRIFSLFFDLNQGIILPLIMVYIGIILFIILYRKKWDKSFYWLSLCIILSVLMAIPITSAPNWNSGAEYIARYGYWLSVPIYFSFILLFKNTYTSKSIFLICIILTIALGSWFRFDKDAFSYVRINPIAQFFINHAPSLYNPIPEIFIERVQNKEGFNNNEMFIYVYKNNINKILIHETKLERISKLLDKQDLKIKKTELGWIYINNVNLLQANMNLFEDGFYHFDLAVPFKINHIYSFKDIVVGKGWSVLEEYHRWSSGNKSTILINTPDIDSSKNSELNLNIEGFALNEKQIAVIKFNGNEIFNGSIPKDGFKNLKMDQAWIEPSSINFLTFDFPHAQQPDNGDSRELAFAIKNLSLQYE